MDAYVLIFYGDRNNHLTRECNLVPGTVPFPSKVGDEDRGSAAKDGRSVTA